MDQGDQGRHRHPPLEGDRQVDRHQHHEDHQAEQGLLRDLVPPAGADDLAVDLLDRDVQRLGEAVADGVRALRLLGADLDPDLALVGVLHQGGGVVRDTVRRALHLRDRQAGLLHGVDRAALELDAQVQAHRQADRGDQHDDAGDAVPELAAPDEVEADLALVEPVAQIGEA